MEITIKAQCPNCKEDIVFSHESKVLENEKKVDTFNEYIRRQNEEALMGDSFFNIMKKATLNQNDFFDDLYKIVGMKAVKAHGLPKSVRLVQNYFDNLRFKIKATDDPRELLRISIKLAKAKAVVSKEVQQEIKKQKPRVLAMIKKRVKELSRKNKK